MKYNIVYQRDSRSIAEYILVLNDDELGSFINAYDEGATEFYHDGKLNRLNRINEIAIFEISFFEIDSTNLEKAVKLAQMREIIPNVKTISTCFTGYGNKVTTKFIKGKWGWNKDQKNNMIEKIEKKEGKIFISHAQIDSTIVNAFCKLILVQALGIKYSDIFNTSLDGSGIRSGNDFRKTIKEKLEESSLVLQFISTNYKKSEICLNEMGAAWVFGATVVPLIIEPHAYDVGFIHSTTQQIQLVDKKKIKAFIDDHKDVLAKDGYRANNVDEGIEEFLVILEKELLKTKIKTIFPDLWTLTYHIKDGNSGTISKMEIKNNTELFEEDKHRFNITKIEFSDTELKFTKRDVKTNKDFDNVLKIIKMGEKYEGKENVTIDIIYSKLN